MLCHFAGSSHSSFPFNFANVVKKNIEPDEAVYPRLRELAVQIFPRICIPADGMNRIKYDTTMTGEGVSDGSVR